MSEHRHAVVTAVAGQSFEQAILPHLEAAYRLARWHTRNPHDADDVVQEASLRALRYFGTFTGGNARAWFLRIVRNACIDWRGRRGRAAIDPFDEQEHSGEWPARNPETSLLAADVAQSITRAMNQLPDRLRQVLILRELQGLSYRELADVINVPPGTVMSRLSRARQAFRAALDAQGQTRMPRASEEEQREADAIVA
jgi:RNA polymerase sigma-70 factor (ECF subfamily)